MDSGGTAGLSAATLMVAGNIMGSGIFMVPVALSQFGSVSTLAWALTVFAVACLALVYAKLASLDGDSAGGSYAFCKRAFGAYAGVVANAVYLLSVCAGNVAGSLVGVSFVTQFVAMDSNTLTLLAVAVIWIMTLLNSYGSAMIVRVQSVCTVLTCAPIFTVATLGWLTFDSAIFWASWNTSGASDWVAVQRSFNTQLWAFTGMETAAAIAAIVRNPKRDVPIATVLGVLVAAVGYVLSCTVIMGTIAHEDLLLASAPFADVMRLTLGEWGAVAVSVCAIVGCLGSTAGWMLVAGETAKAAAEDGAFPAVFRSNAGLVLMSVAMTAVCALLMLLSQSAHPFALVASLSSLLTLLPYAMTALSLLRLSATSALWKGAVCVSVAYCCAALAGSAAQHVALTLALVAAVMLALHLTRAAK